MTTSINRSNDKLSKKKKKCIEMTKKVLGYRQTFIDPAFVDVVPGYKTFLVSKYYRCLMQKRF